MMTKALIEARDLHTYYDESHILRGVSLVLARGEALGLMGRNGMGKTTLIRTIMGLVRPRAGSVLITGEDMTHAPAFRVARRGIAYVPEGRGIFASLSVRENLEIAERPGVDGAHAWTMARVLELFPRLGQRLRNGGDQLSGGEQQMLAIARALLTNPRVLITGEDMTHAPAFRVARRGIAYVPEGRGIFASLSVRENLEIAERPGVDGAHGWTMARVLALFPRLGQRLRNGGDQLSGGEQQMLAIARALLTNPRVLILDEATEGLAPIIREEIWKTIRLVRASGIATLLVDKSVAEVTALADRVIILVKGQAVFEGTPQDLHGEPEIMQRHLGV